MGWWRKRSQAEFERVSGAYTDFMTGETHIGRMTVGGDLLQDLPSRIEGRGEMPRNHIISFLEREIPGIGTSLYKWVEPTSKGELIGEMLSSWPGAPRHEDKEPDEEDT